MAPSGRGAAEQSHVAAKAASEPLPSTPQLEEQAPLVATASAAEASVAQPAASPTPAPEWHLLLPAMLAWNLASITVILYNKYLYSGPFPHPVTLTALHMLANTAFTQALVASGLLSVPALGWDTYLRVVPGLGLLFAGSLACSNLAAARLAVATVQMIKALAPLITVLTMFTIGTEKYRHSLLLIALLMTLGVGVASYGEAHFDALGFALQVTALLCESIRMVCIQYTIQSSLPKSNPLAALALFAPACAACLIPLSLALEPGALAGLLLPAPAAAATASLPLPLLLAGNACAAIAINVCAVWLLSLQNGPLLITLVGVVKDIELIVASVFLFSTSIARLQVGGYAIALLGINSYHVYKGPQGADMGLAQLLWAATSNYTALAMALGVLGIACIAR